MSKITLNNSLRFVHAYDDAAKEFLELTNADAWELFQMSTSSKEMGCSIGPLGCYKVSEENNIEVRLVQPMNYSDVKMDLNSALEVFYVLALNKMAWGLQDQPKDMSLFSDEFYRAKNTFLEKHSEEVNGAFLSFID